MVTRKGSQATKTVVQGDHEESRQDDFQERFYWLEDNNKARDGGEKRHRGAMAPAFRVKRQLPGSSNVKTRQNSIAAMPS